MPKLELDQNLHVEATLALDVHEERVRGLHQTLEFVFLLLQFSWRVQQIDVAMEHLQNNSTGFLNYTSFKPTLYQLIYVGDQPGDWYAQVRRRLIEPRLRPSLCSPSCRLAYTQLADGAKEKDGRGGGRYSGQQFWPTKQRYCT